jgi:hypothetical protein
MLHRTSRQKGQQQTFCVGINRIQRDPRNAPKKSQMLQTDPARMGTSQYIFCFFLTGDPIPLYVREKIE